MEEGELIGLGDLLRTKLYDSEGANIGHLHDMAIDLAQSPPPVTYLGIHVRWTDRFAGIELVRPVEDIAFLVPWAEIASQEEDSLHLRSQRSELPAVSAEGKLLTRRDILNKQMVDQEGRRLQRVDEVIMRRKQGRLFLEGLMVGTEWFPPGGRMGKLVNRLRRRYNRTEEMNIIPYEAIVYVDPDAVVIGSRADTG